ncbi:DNA (cytosine-5-)-methyltransferase [Spiroplasma endosymbiont of Amphibalanus improvisus]|uniref:DNA (cytosine-5-)-methyltransferase n=1 Tax=Spiroplasma endosymbiont of Amphibalanus improvisus TaxID=3066327 RepID=UPI00313C4B1C
MTNKKIKFVDLFAGIGGFHQALKFVAQDNNIDIECVFVSEIDKYAIETYTHNFNYDKNQIINIRDIDNIEKDVPEHDFLFAGFPCQTFSNAGNKKGFLDEIRGTLFFEIAKILNEKKPKYILLENVKHIIKHDNGETWKIINNKLKEIGYLIPKKPLVLSPHNFGIPQERERVFIPGVLKSKIAENIDEIDLEEDINKYKKNFNSDNFIQEKNKIYNNILETKINEKYLLKNNANGSYLQKVFDAWNEFLQNVKKPLNRTLPVIWLKELTQTYELNPELMTHWRYKYISDMRDIYKNNKIFIDSWFKKHDPLSWKIREQKFEWQAGKDINDIKESFIQLRQSGIRCKRPVKFPTLVAMVQIPIIFDNTLKEWRYLTPRETANLQSFPKTFKLHNELNTSNDDYYSYKQFGNSVNVEIIKIIQKTLLDNY